MIRRSLGLEHALLGFLRQSPQHGYQLHQQVCNLTGLGLVWRVKQSQLYALLEKLEQSGHMTSQLELQESHPPRRVFSLTEKGYSAYQTWLKEPVSRPHQMRQEFMAKWFFALLESPEVARLLIERQRETCLEWLAALEKDAQATANGGQFSRLVFRYRIGQVEAIQKWLESLTSDASNRSYG